MKDVFIYSTPTCMYCRAAKQFFKENNIAYTEFDVSTDSAKREEMIQKSGQMGVPVIMIGGEMIIGFNRDKISQLLGI